MPDPTTPTQIDDLRDVLATLVSTGFDGNSALSQEGKDTIRAAETWVQATYTPKPTDTNVASTMDGQFNNGKLPSSTSSQEFSQATKLAAPPVQGDDWFDVRAWLKNTGWLWHESHVITSECMEDLQAAIQSQLEGAYMQGCADQAKIDEARRNDA